MPQVLTGYPRRIPDLVDPATVWNWAQNSTLAPATSVCSPATEDELRSVVAACGGRVRIVGSKMSPGRLLELSAEADTLLDMSRLRGVMELTDDTATFAGGTPLQDVYSTLSARGRMLPSSPGVIASQTLGGALATGTHGQGLAQSSIADAALSIRMVLADGSVMDVGRDHPWFGAFQVGLGALGVISSVTLRTEAAAVYTCFKDAASADTLDEDLLAWNHEHALTKSWWFPDANQVHVWRANPAGDEEIRAYREGGEKLVELAEVSDAMNATVDRTLEQMRSDTRIVDENGKPFRTVTRFKDFTDVIGDVYQVFCRGIATPQINVEVGIPLERAGEVIRVIKEWHALTRPRMHYPIILRCTGPSSAWLSPAHGRATCFFGFVVYYAQDGSLSPEGVEFLRAVEGVLASQGGRPHWGKYFEESLYDWQGLYPQWEAFRQVREALDPDQKFANPFTARLFA